TPVPDALELIDRRVTALGIERVPLGESYGRVLAEPVSATSSVPPFNRAAMDGYAVRGEETIGASPYNPIPVRCVGQALPGRAWTGSLGPFEAVAITTGAALPRGADAVVKFEDAQRTGDTVLVTEPTPPARHVGRAGEDIVPGTLVLSAGRVLRPQDLGVL